MMPDDAWPLLSGTAPPTSRSLDNLIAATQPLLARFHALRPSDLHRLATDLATIADRLDLIADREEEGEPGG